MAEYADELKHAFEFIMLLRIHNQFAQIEAGRTPDNFINPAQAEQSRETDDQGGVQPDHQECRTIIVETYKHMIL